MIIYLAEQMFGPQRGDQIDIITLIKIGSSLFVSCSDENANYYGYNIGASALSQNESGDFVISYTSDDNSPRQLVFRGVYNFFYWE